MIGRNEDKRREKNAFFLLHKHTTKLLPGVRNGEAPVSTEPAVKHLLLKACECEFQISYQQQCGRSLPSLTCWLLQILSSSQMKQRNVPDLNDSLLRNRTMKTMSHILQV